jgi:hypothetical protein
MFRKLLLATVAGLGLLAPLTLSTNAEAHEFRHEHRHWRAFRVYYHDPCRPGWVCAGTYQNYQVALRAAEPFRCRGFAISVRP